MGCPDHVSQKPLRCCRYDRIMVMDSGIIHQLDTPHNIIDHPADDYVRKFVIKNIDIKINSLIQFARTQED